MGADLLAILIIVAVLAGGTKSGRNFIREAQKATGWRTPRAAMQHHSGRAGALAGRAIASAARIPGRSSARPGRATAAGGIGRGRRGPLIPLMWRGDPRDAGDSAASAAPAAAGPAPRARDAAPAPAAPALAPKPRVCASCGNPEGGKRGPLVLYRDPDGAGLRDNPYLVHKAHFGDESTGYYGKPYQPAPGPGDSGPGKAPAAAPSPGTAPGAERRSTRMTPIHVNLDPPTTDGEFLESCVELANALKRVAEMVSNWADGLGSLNLPQSVLNPLHQIADGINDAASGANQAATNFESEFEDAREVASRGMHFTGQDAA